MIELTEEECVMFDILSIGEIKAQRLEAKACEKYKQLITNPEEETDFTNYKNKTLAAWRDLEEQRRMYTDPDDVYEVYFSKFVSHKIRLWESNPIDMEKIMQLKSSFYTDKYFDELALRSNNMFCCCFIRKC